MTASIWLLGKGSRNIGGGGGGGNKRTGGPGGKMGGGGGGESHAVRRHLPIPDTTTKKSIARLQKQEIKLPL